MKINWYSNVGQGQGYSGSSEKIMVALEEAGSDVRLIQFANKEKKNLTPQGEKIASKPFEIADIGIGYGFPNSFSSMLHNKFKVGFTMFETDRLPNGIKAAEWCGGTGRTADALNKLDLLFVPSEHNKELFKREGVNIPIEVVHLGVDANAYVKMTRPPRDTFTFLMSGVLTIRKNPGDVISAFLDLFKDRKDVRLVLKTNSGTLGHMSWPYENLTVIDKYTTPEQQFAIMRDADCFVFPSRGEGFGLTPLEAMSTGLPVIFADNTGMHEYANKEYNYPIPCPSMSPAKRFPKNWGDVGNWYEVDYSALKSTMEYVVSHRKEAYKKGLKAADWVYKQWTFKQTANRILSLLEKYTK